MATVSPFTTGAAEEAYIKQEAARLGLDPEAVLAVAASEGVSLPGEPGDPGIVQGNSFTPASQLPAGTPTYDTSFGPWELHATGALPASVWAQGPAYANAWANSATGIDYALAAIRKDVGGATSGDAEIAAQVTNFENPAANLVGGEIARAEQTYASGGGPSTGGGGGGGVLSTIESGAGDALTAVALTNPVTAGADLLGLIPGGSSIVNLPGDVGKAVGGLFSGVTTWLEYEVPLFGLYAALTLLALVFLVLGVNRAAGGAPARAVKTAGMAAGA